MIKNLVKMANHLDKKGLLKEADLLDKIIIKISKITLPDPKEYEDHQLGEEDDFMERLEEQDDYLTSLHEGRIDGGRTGELELDPSKMSLGPEFDYDGGFMKDKGFSIISEEKARGIAREQLSADGILKNESAMNSLQNLVSPAYYIISSYDNEEYTAIKRSRDDFSGPNGEAILILMADDSSSGDIVLKDAKVLKQNRGNEEPLNYYYINYKSIPDSE